MSSNEETKEEPFQLVLIAQGYIPPHIWLEVLVPILDPGYLVPLDDVVPPDDEKTGDD